MKSFAISLVFLGIATILAVVGTLLGSAGASQLLALPVALAAMTACLMLVGGLLIGVIDNFSAVYVSSEYRTAVPLILLILIILMRPQGLLGTPEGRAV